MQVCHCVVLIFAAELQEFFRFLRVVVNERFEFNALKFVSFDTWLFFIPAFSLLIRPSMFGMQTSKILKEK